jgi:hypothetical protein
VLTRDQEISRTKNQLEIDQREIAYLESFLAKAQDGASSLEKLGQLERERATLQGQLKKAADLEEKAADLEHDLRRLAEKAEARRADRGDRADRLKKLELELEVSRKAEEITRSNVGALEAEVQALRRQHRKEEPKAEPAAES